MSEMIFMNDCKVAKFPAPEGKNYRKIVKDYMMKMAMVEWTPKESFDIKWKGDPRFKIELRYEKGVTYHGITYTDTKGNFDMFEQLLENGVFTPNSEYYEECFGNHCSSSMDMAFQQCFDFPYTGTVKPNSRRGTMLKLCGNLKQPTVYGDGYDAADVWAINSKNDVMEAFASVDTGDILYYSDKRKSGHARMISLPAEVVRFDNGLIDPENSYIYTVEQTNAWDKTEAAQGRNTTWFVDHKYSFAKLYEKRFKPVTFTAYTSGEKLKDAYIIYSGKNNAETIKNGVSGTVTTTFPLTYVRITIRDKEGNLVRHGIFYNLPNDYHVDISELNEQLNLDTLEKGTYSFKLRAGIARGGADFENFEFTV